MNAGSAKDRMWDLLRLLADGHFHSGEALARQVGVCRASVFNALSSLADHGVTVQRIRGRGYRLERPWERLDAAAIRDYLGTDARKFDIEILLQAASSNTLLLRRAAEIGNDSKARRGSVLAVELQTAGRGRMGRTWHSGLGNSLTFSLLWSFDRGLNALSGLSLLAGVAIVRALNKQNATGIGLKWPNDIVTGQGKLGGVLVEAQGDMLGPSTVVIGIGLNCAMPATLRHRIGQPATTLEEVCPSMPTRNRLLAALLQELALALEEFEQGGFSAFRSEWERYHVHQDQAIELQMPDGSLVKGVMRGVDDNGKLCLETSEGFRLFNAGEIRERR